MNIFSLLSPRKVIVFALLAASLLTAPASVPAQASTVTCAPGWFIDNGFCFPCYAGTYSPSGYCINCPAGTWSAATNAISESTCISCPSGEISAPGSKSADACFVPY